MERWPAIGLMPRLDSTVQERRKLWCWTCPQRVDHGIGGSVTVLLAGVLTDEPKDGPFTRSWCARCRCYLPLKTRMKWAHCPIGFW